MGRTILLITGASAVLLAGLAALVAIMAVPEEAGAAFPGKNGRIAFVSDRDGDLDIYTVRPDGSDLRRVTRNSAYDSQPAFSPDGTKIAFSSNRNGAGAQIYVKDLASGEITQISSDNDGSQDGVGGGSPAWSPDGTKIVYTSKDFVDPEFGSPPRLYVVNSDGSEPKPLMEGFGYWKEEAAAWSPIGDKIAFERDQDALYDVWVVDADGSDPTNLFPLSYSHERTPDWSPNGKQIVFSRALDDSTPMDIWKMSPDGSDLRRLTKAGTNDGPPVWSPDGRKIVFARGGDLIKMGADGSDKTNITAGRGYGELLPNFAPFGGTIESRDVLDWQPKPAP